MTLSDKIMNKKHGTGDLDMQDVKQFIKDLKDNPIVEKGKDLTFEDGIRYMFNRIDKLAGKELVEDKE